MSYLGSTLGSFDLLDTMRQEDLHAKNVISMFPEAISDKVGNFGVTVTSSGT